MAIINKPQIVLPAFPETCFEWECPHCKHYHHKEYVQFPPGDQEHILCDGCHKISVVIFKYKEKNVN